MSKQFDDIFCIWESISFSDRITALNLISDNNATLDRSEEILLYLITTAPDPNSIITALKDGGTNSLFWKVWGVLDAKERAVLINFLNRNLIDETTTLAGQTVYDNFQTNCTNTLTPCDLNQYKIIPVWRANALNVINANFDLGPGGVTDLLLYSLETQRNGALVDIDAYTNHIDLAQFDDYWSPLLSDENELFNSSLDPFSPIVLMIREDISVNNQIVLKKDDIITIPVIFLHWLDSSIDSEQNLVTLRVAADGLIVASIIYSGGATTPLLGMDLAIFGTDFVFTIVNESSDAIDPDVAEAWDAVYNLYNIANLPRAVISSSKFLATGSRHFITFVKNTQAADEISKLVINPQFLDDFILQFKQMSQSERIAKLQALDDLILSVRNTPKFNVQGFVPSSLYRNLVKARVEIYNAQFSSTAITMGIQESATLYSPYLKIANGSGVSTSVGNIIYAPTSGKPLLTGVRWLPDGLNSNPVGLVNSIDYVNSNGATESGLLEVLEDVVNPGQFYLKASNAIVSHFDTGVALRNYLNAIPNNVQPNGVSLQQDIYRSLSKNAEDNFGAVPEQMTDATVYSSWGRYDLDAQENAMYFSKALEGNKIEITHYGDWLDFSTYRFANVSLDNLLDLTNAAVREQLKVLKPQLLLVEGGNNVAYEFTNEVASWARNRGYNGIIATGARGSQDYKNIILFEQTYIDGVLQGATKNLIPKTTGIQIVDDFLILEPNINSVTNSVIPAGYQIITRNNSKYIRRDNVSNVNTPRLMVNENGIVVPYLKPTRLASNGLLRDRLKDLNGGSLPDNHQAHHIVPDNVVRNSPIHQEAISRGLYDVDRTNNGKILAETEEDYVSLSEAYPTHYGSHPQYDDAINSQIDDLIETNDIDILNLDNMSNNDLNALINAIENRALNVLTNWQPSKLN